MDAFLVRRLQALAKSWALRAEQLEKRCGGLEVSGYTLRLCGAELFRAVQDGARDAQRAKALEASLTRTEGTGPAG